jgi:GDPmannose 4,6-dehydratase
MKRAFITGITGQDGSYLAELLLSKGYEVHGLVHQRSWEAVVGRPGGEADVAEHLHLHPGDLNDGAALTNLVHELRPDEVYNLGAQSHVRMSFEMPVYTESTNSGGTVRLLEALRSAKLDARFFQATTSDMFGLTPPPQSESSPFHPRSPYGVSKLFSHWCTVNYREAYDMFAVSGILFNHESPRRSEDFLSRKVSLAAARIAAGLQDGVELGNLSAVRDWGYAPEYVEGMWLMLQQEEPTDFVLATGRGTSVQEYVEAAFSHAGLDWTDHVRHNAVHERPAEVHALIGDASRAHELLGWKAQTDASELARLMVDADRELVGRAGQAR